MIIGMAFFIGFSFEQMGKTIGVPLGIMNMLGWFVLANYLVNEIRSILENLVDIGVPVDNAHVHAHLVFHSVNADTGKKYHSNAHSYYKQIRATSDRLCREYGLSVIMQGEINKAVSYIEWLRQSKGQPTFRSMLETDLRTAIEDANDLGHFYLLMEHKGYEISHGNRLGFRLRGQERFMYPERKNPLFTEDGIRASI